MNRMQGRWRILQRPMCLFPKAAAEKWIRAASLGSDTGKGLCYFLGLPLRMGGRAVDVDVQRAKQYFEKDAL